MNTSRTELLAEIRATSEASMIVRILNELVNEATARQFTRNRSSRIQRWVQLEKVAQAQAGGLLAAAKVAKPRAIKPKVAGTGTPINEAAALQSA